jgi:hypothetical protein
LNFEHDNDTNSQEKEYKSKKKILQFIEKKERIQNKGRAEYDLPKENVWLVLFPYINKIY